MNVSRGQRGECVENARVGRCRGAGQHLSWEDDGWDPSYGRREGRRQCRVSRRGDGRESRRRWRDRACSLSWSVAIRARRCAAPSPKLNTFSLLLYKLQRWLIILSLMTPNAILFDHHARRSVFSSTLFLSLIPPSLYLTGFHKRKQARAEAARNRAQQRQKQQRLHDRQEVPVLLIFQSPSHPSPATPCSSGTGCRKCTPSRAVLWCPLSVHSLHFSILTLHRTS